MKKAIILICLITVCAYGQSGYEPFLIAPFQTGLSIGMEPWMSPIDAFPTLENARINKGVLEKRQGYQLFATMKHGSTEQSSTAIMGIHTYLSDGMPQLLIFDTVRVNLYNPTDDTVTDISGGSDIFHGGADDFFYFCNWLDVGYMTNNVDQIYQYSGSGNVAVFNIQVDSDSATNHVNTCRYIFIKNDRMLLLDTVEHDIWYPQRARYSPVLSTDFSATGGGYVDAPTEERMVSAGWVGQDICVYFSGGYYGSLWKIRTTGDSDLPFRWEKITTTNTSLAPYSGVEFNDGFAVIGLNNIIWYDGFQIQYLDLPKLRDIIDIFEPSKIRYSYGHNEIQNQHILFTYTTIGSSYPDRVLDYNILEKCWSVYTMNAHCFGTFDDQAVPIWTDADDVFVADGATMSQMTIDSREVLNSPFPFTLMGSRTSKVYKLHTGNYDGTDDANGVIAVDIRSSRWNPYLKQNRTCYLGSIAFLVDNDPNASATISFYKNSRSTAWTTRTLSCDSADDGADKFWTSLHLGGEQGDFHSIKISHSARNNRPRIHAIMLLMKAGGPLNL